MEAWFAARYRDAVEKSGAFLKEGEERVVIHGRRKCSVDELIVVTEWAAIVASTQEHRTGDASGEIKERHLLKSVYEHKLFLSFVTIPERDPEG